jgi:hypothetical protein
MATRNKIEVYDSNGKLLNLIPSGSSSDVYKNSIPVILDDSTNSKNAIKYYNQRFLQNGFIRPPILNSKQLFTPVIIPQNYKNETNVINSENNNLL